MPTAVQISFPYGLEDPLTRRFADPLPRGEGTATQCSGEHENDFVHPARRALKHSAAVTREAPGSDRSFFVELLVDSALPRGRGWREAPGEGFLLGKEQLPWLLLSLPTMNWSFLILKAGLRSPVIDTASGRWCGTAHSCPCGFTMASSALPLTFHHDCHPDRRIAQDP